MALLLVTGASSAMAQGPRTAQRDLDAARERWREGHVRDYHFSVERVCFCTPAFRGPATIVVRDGAPLDPPAPFEEVATVPRLHAIVQTAIDDHVDRLTVAYDELGVPRSIDVDPSTTTADEEVSYRVAGFGADTPRAVAKGDLRLALQWRGPQGDARRTLACRDGALASAWPDPAVCARLLATPTLIVPIAIETRDVRGTPDPQLFTVVGHIEGLPVQFTWRGQGSSTRLARLREWETTLGPDAIAAIRTS
jgi:hypothetical protein